MATHLRILDANANRAREALRVMEEAARFVLGDAELAGALKQMRHDLTATTKTIDGLEDHRDTPGDVGTNLATAAEQDRRTVQHVAAAAGKRLSEALRVLEEYGKLVDVSFAGAVEQLRYRGYELEQRLHRQLAGGRAQQWRLCVLLTASLCRNGDWLAVARAAIAGGADCLQLREKDLDDRELLKRACELVRLGRSHGVSAIINDRPDIAVLAEADGVHVGQGDLPCASVRKLVGGELLIGVSTSNLDEARRAVRDGADYCGVGPMFATTTKHKDDIVGPAYLKQFLAALPQFPALAIGGITWQNIGQLVDVGVKGVAISSAVCGADDPTAVVRACIEAMSRP